MNGREKERALSRWDARERETLTRNKQICIAGEKHVNVCGMYFRAVSRVNTVAIRAA